MNNLVSVEWLLKNIEDNNTVLLDASLKSTAEGTQSQFGSLTIPGARYFDLKNKFSDPSGQFPNTIPTPDQFQLACRELGINHHSRIIVFDNMGIYSAPRVWWLFKAMGHENVAVLDGGLPEWINHGQKVAPFPTEATYSMGNFTAHFQSQWVVTYQQVLDNISTEDFCIVDARSADRFMGHAPEPRKNLMSGHIPGSVNMPYLMVLDKGRFKDQAALDLLFQPIHIQNKKLVFSCGSGLTACIILLANAISSQPASMKVYDGSWTEWAERQHLTSL